MSNYHYFLRFVKKQHDILRNLGFWRCLSKAKNGSLSRKCCKNWLFHTESCIFGLTVLSTGLRKSSHLKQTELFLGFWKFYTYLWDISSFKNYSVVRWFRYLYKKNYLTYSLFQMEGTLKYEIWNNYCYEITTE